MDLSYTHGTLGATKVPSGHVSDPASPSHELPFRVPRSRFSMSFPPRELLDLLDLEPLEVNIYRGRNRDIGTGRVFGGQVLAQALVAARRTVDALREAHSLHGYFIL